MSLIESMKPDWTVSLGSDAPGQILINQYAAQQEYDGASHGTRAGANLSFDYYSSETSLTNYRFVQIIYTNSHASGAPSDSYIDPWVNDDPSPYAELPWYWTEPEQGTCMHDGYYHFEDGPRRSYDVTNAISWNAACFLVETGYNTVTIHDGVYWGWGTIGQQAGGLDGLDEYAVDKSGVQAVPEPTFWSALLPMLAMLRRRKEG